MNGIDKVITNRN